MTQAFNLAQFANKLNTSGQTDNTGLQNSAVTVTAGTGMSGGGSVALGSSITLTNAGVTSVNGQTGAVTVSSSSGTVTSVATGNGLQGGTITSSGTLSIAAPSFQSVGSYCYMKAQANYTNPSGSVSPNTNYSGDNAKLYNAGQCGPNPYGNAPGTWRCVGAEPGNSFGYLGVRIA